LPVTFSSFAQNRGLIRVGLNLTTGVNWAQGADMITTEQKRQIIDLSIERIPIRKIAERVGVAPSTVMRHVSENQVEIDTEKYALLEKDFAERGILKAQRIEKLANLLSNIETGITQELIDSMPVEKRITISLQIQKLIAAEIRSFKLIKSQKPDFSPKHSAQILTEYHDLE